MESTSLDVIIQADIAGILAEPPDGLSLTNIGTKAGIRPDNLGRFMRFLAAKSYFKESAHEFSSSIYLPLRVKSDRKAITQNNRLSSQLVSHPSLRHFPICKQGPHVSRSLRMTYESKARFFRITR